MVNRALTKTTFIRPCLNFASAIPRTLERVANNFLTLKINTFTIYRSICDSKLILTGFPVLNYERITNYEFSNFHGNRILPSIITSV